MVGFLRNREMNPFGVLSHSEVAFILFISANIMLFRGNVGVMMSLYVYDICRRSI